MNDVRLPIETSREGNKIAKVCVEDVYKMINRINSSIEKANKNVEDILESTHIKYWSDNNTYYEGNLIVGTGTSQPCITDSFDEEIGNDIAFMKAKLNANLKKYKLITKILTEYDKMCKEISKEYEKINSYILFDLFRIRIYNPDYLKDIECELGIIEDPEEIDLAQ